MVANVSEYSKVEIEKKLESNNVEEVTSALLYLTFNINDFNWVQNMVLKMIEHSNEDVCGLAITCVGHIARIYSKIDRAKVMPYLEKKAKDERFTGRVEDAIDDIDMFT